MSAPPNNTNAAKPNNEQVKFPVIVRGTRAERRAWRKAARGQKFNTWARVALNAQEETKC